jgi:hypothetical protein
MSKNKNEISILNKKIPIKVEDMDIFDLHFWVENPRVNSAIKRKHGNKPISDKDVENLLKEEEHVKELYQEIKKHGGLIDEIVVKGKTVLEGNSRLCAYRMLYRKAEEAQDEDEMLKWLYIKARIIPDGTTDEQIFTILGNWHIKGKKQWDTFEKAAYLKRMKADHGYSTDRIAEIIGDSQTFVEQNIEAHDLMIEHKVFEPSKFSYFIELVKNKSIKEEQEKDPHVRTKIIKAIKNDQFSKAEQIRHVPKVLKDKVAKRSFFEQDEPFSEALEIAVDRHPELEGALFGLLKRTSTRLGTIEAKEIEKIRLELQSDTNKKDIVRRFYKEVKKFCKHIGISDDKKDTAR